MLIFTTLLANSADDKLDDIFLIFSQKTDFDTSWKLFSGKSKTIIFNMASAKLFT